MFGAVQKVVSTKMEAYKIADTALHFPRLKPGHGGIGGKCNNPNCKGDHTQDRFKLAEEYYGGNQ